MRGKHSRLTWGCTEEMHDALTNYLVDKTRAVSPLVIKCALPFPTFRALPLADVPCSRRYIPYGELKEVRWSLLCSIQPVLTSALSAGDALPRPARDREQVGAV